MVPEVINSKQEPGQKACFYSKYMLQKRHNLSYQGPQRIEPGSEYFVVFDWLKLRKVILRLIVVA